MSQKNKIEITWQCEDGYHGGARPHSFNMSEDEFYGIETIEEAMALVDETVENEFRDKVTYSINRDNIQKKVEAVLAKLKEEEP